MSVILVVDDERELLRSLSRALELEEYEVLTAEDGLQMQDVLSRKSVDLVLLDVNLPGQSGLELLPKIRERNFDGPVIVMSGQATMDMAVQATRLGAHDFLEKPISSERLLLSVGRAIEYSALRARAIGKTASGLLGSSPSVVELRNRIRLAASSHATVLVLGERGSGKELVAAAIHTQSKRAAAPFEKLNCAAVPNDLVESELFGHEIGAFTGAVKQRKGKFERAHKGTLFLDEVGDMPLQMQAKLLRVLEQGEIERVGGQGVIKVDVRVVAATNRPLDKDVSEGRFRADLFDRLNVVPLRVPPLRERPTDIAELANFFLHRAIKEHGLPNRRFSEAALKQLATLLYPGNVRELRNLVDRLVILTDADLIDANHVNQSIAGGSQPVGSMFRPGVRFDELVREAERDILAKAYEYYSGKMTRVAQELGLERSHLYKKMRAAGLRKGPADGEGDDEGV